MYSSHPYIFFNQDGMSITFVGFMVTRNGDLVDPAHGGVLEGAIMTQQLYTGLIANKVNFEEDYRKWQKATMIEKIATVMGIEYPYDPDESYVLTVDNLIKILAIQMRFRSVCLSVDLSACLSACLSVCLSVHLSACLSVCLIACTNFLISHAHTHTYTDVVSQWSSWERRDVERQG